MIRIKQQLKTIKSRVRVDFKDLVLDLEDDMKAVEEHKADFYVWYEDDVMMGYMGIITTEALFFCSYTKAYNNKVIKQMYKLLKELYDTNIPVITDGTNFKHCKNHVEPFGGTGLYRWVLD